MCHVFGNGDDDGVRMTSTPSPPLMTSVEFEQNGQSKAREIRSVLGFNSGFKY
jgi:hypothetical protein